MKKIITIFLSCLFIIACKKTATTPDAPPPQQQAQNPTPTPTNTLTSQEQSLIGYWIMDSSVNYNNNVRAGGYVYTNSVTCIMDFKSTLHSSGQYLDVNSGYNQCLLSATFWKAPNQGSFMLGTQIFPITLLTTNQLIFIQGGGPSEWRYYFHK